MSKQKDSTPPQAARRGFITRIVAASAALVAASSTVRMLGATPVADASNDMHPDWMAELTGKHRTVFDNAAHKNGKPLTQAKNYLDAWRDAFKVPDKDVNLVIGVHGEGIPYVLSDALWTRFHIGEQYEVTDGATKGAATRNVFTTTHAASAGLVSPEQSVDGLQKRGVRFLICTNTIAGASKKLAAAGLGTAEEIRAAIVAGLLPGVIIVPAMVVALTQLQERGVKYTKIA